MVVFVVVILRTGKNNHRYKYIKLIIIYIILRTEITQMELINVLPQELKKHIFGFIIPDTVVFMRHTRRNMATTHDGQITDNLQNLPRDKKELKLLRIPSRNKYRYYICISVKRMVCDCNGYEYCRNRHCDEMREMRNMSSYKYVGKDLNWALILLYCAPIKVTRKAPKSNYFTIEPPVFSGVA
jgi:hypothetical protein